MRVDIPGFEVPSAILTSLLRQYQDTGLFLTTQGIDKTTVALFWRRWQFLKVVFNVAGPLSSGPLSIEDCPVIYNPSRWDSDRLCGYAGRDLTLTPDELVASYLEYWAISINDGQAATDHLVKCLLWFHANHGRDLATTLRFLADLHAAGFIVKFPVFQSVWWGFLDYYTREPDLSFLEGSTLKDRQAINHELGILRGTLGSRPRSRELAGEMLGWQIDYVLALADRARNADSLDAWFSACARLYVPSFILGSIHHHPEDFDLTFMQRCVLSFIEEMSADLGALVGDWRKAADHLLPLSWELSSLVTVGRHYRKLYPPNQWLERLTGDRLLIPEPIRNQLMAIEALEPEDVRVPPDWRMCSDSLAVPFCSALGLDPSSVRAFDFMPEQLEQACIALGHPSPLIPDPGDEKGTARALMQDAAGVTEARRALIDAERSQFSLSMNSPYSDMEAGQLEFLGRLYPWFASYRRWSGLRAVEEKRPEQALANLRFAIELEPNDAQAWRGLVFVSLQAKRPRDATFFEAVARGMEGPAEEAHEGHFTQQNRG